MRHVPLPRISGCSFSSRLRNCILGRGGGDMRVFSWIVAGIGIGLGVTLLVLLNEPKADYATGYDGVEDAARKTFRWGTKSRAKGMAESVVGAVKEGVGKVTGIDR